MMNSYIYVICIVLDYATETFLLLYSLYYIHILHFHNVLNLRRHTHTNYLIPWKFNSSPKTHLFFSVVSAVQSIMNEISSFKKIA